MKTKYILHGGFNKDQTDEDNTSFYTEILKDAPPDPKILLVLFAKDDDRVTLATTKLMAEFNKNKWQEKLDFEIASELTFTQQIMSADIIYFAGGTTLKLLGVLKKVPNLGGLLEGRVIAGESAGANVLATFCYSPSAGEVIECLGLLPIKVIPHYREEYKSKLDSPSPELELLLLPEYEFKVIEVS